MFQICYEEKRKNILGFSQHETFVLQTSELVAENDNEVVTLSRKTGFKYSHAIQLWFAASFAPDLLVRCAMAVSIFASSHAWDGMWS